MPEHITPDTLTPPEREAWRLAGNRGLRITPADVRALLSAAWPAGVGALAQIKRILVDFDWDRGDRQYALEAVERALDLTAAERTFTGPARVVEVDAVSAYPPELADPDFVPGFGPVPGSGFDRARLDEPDEPDEPDFDPRPRGRRPGRHVRVPAARARALDLTPIEAPGPASAGPGASVLYLVRTSRNVELV